MAPESETFFTLEGGDVRFIVFDAAVADTVSGLELYKLPYARNLMTRPDGLAQVGGLLDQVSGRRPQQGPPPARMEKYVVAKTDALKIELLQKPVPAQPQMLQLVPDKKLDAGVYSLFAVRVQGGQRFIVNQLFEIKGPASTPFCIDLAQTGGFGGAMDESDARMQRPYYLAKEKYSPCGASANVNPPSSPLAVSPGTVPSPPSPLGTTKYSGNFGQAAQLLLYPDGTFNEQGDKADGSGTYTISGTYITKADKLVLKGSEGSRAEFLIRGDGLYDRFGRRAVWRKATP
jgi:hypothetical protein